MIAIAHILGACRFYLLHSSMQFTTVPLAASSHESLVHDIIDVAAGRADDHYLSVFSSESRENVVMP